MQLHVDTRKTEALRLVMSKSIARALDLDAKAVSHKKLRPLAETLEEKRETSARQSMKEYFLMTTVRE